MIPVPDEPRHPHRTRRITLTALAGASAVVMATALTTAALAGTNPDPTPPMNSHMAGMQDQLATEMQAMHDSMSPAMRAMHDQMNPSDMAAMHTQNAAAMDPGAHAAHHATP